MADDSDTRPVTKITPVLVADQMVELRALFPKAVTEGEGRPQVNSDRLRATLGDLDALTDQDTYTFNWTTPAATS